MEPLRRWIALGATVYGAPLASLHDMLMHQRFGMRSVSRRGYFKPMHHAPRMYNAVKDKEGGASLGFLFAPAPVLVKRGLAERNGR